MCPAARLPSDSPPAGLGAHVGKGLSELGQAEGYRNLVIDSAYRKNGTHNDNTVLLSALNFTPEQNDSLDEYTHLPPPFP